MQGTFKRERSSVLQGVGLFCWGIVVRGVAYCLQAAICRGRGREAIIVPCLVYVDFVQLLWYYWVWFLFWGQVLQRHHSCMVQIIEPMDGIEKVVVCFLLPGDTEFVGQKVLLGWGGKLQGSREKMGCSIYYSGAILGVVWLVRQGVPVSVVVFCVSVCGIGLHCLDLYLLIPCWVPRLL